MYAYSTITKKGALRSIGLLMVCRGPDRLALDVPCPWLNACVQLLGAEDGRT